MRPWYLLAALATTVFVGACGSDDCEGKACDLRRDCRTICDTAIACLAERAEKADEAVPDGLFDGCVDMCVGEHAAGPMAICADCVRSFTCDLVDHCYNSDMCRPTRYDLQVDGTGFEAWDGAAVYVSVMEVEDDAFYFPENTRRSTITGGGFQLTMRSALRSRYPIALDVLVDVDGNAACDEDDFVFRQDLPTISGPVTVDLQPPTTESVEACEWYSTFAEPLAFVEGSGFAASDGKWVLIGLIDESTPAPERLYQIVRLEGGSFEARFRRSAAKPEAWIEWMIDDGDWSCGAFDIGGIVALGPIEYGDRRLAISPADATADFCIELPVYPYGE